MNLLEKMRNDYINQQRKVKAENQKHFDRAFNKLIRENEGKTIADVRAIILEMESESTTAGSIYHSEFNNEFRKRFDEYVERQLIVKEQEI